MNKKKQLDKIKHKISQLEQMKSRPNANQDSINKKIVKLNAIKANVEKLPF